MKFRGIGISGLYPRVGITFVFVTLLVFSARLFSAAESLITEPQPDSNVAGVTAALTVDQLLQLREENAEALRSLDVEIEQEIERGETKIRNHTRMAFDKAIGKMRLQQFGPDGALRADMMVEGTKAYYKGLGGAWKELPMDEQTRATLETLGVNMGQASEGGLAGQAKVSENSGKAERVAKRITRVKRHMNIERDSGQDDPACKCRAICHRPKADAKVKPFEEELELIDEQTGLTIEKSQWVLDKKLPDGKEAFPSGLRRRKGRHGQDLVEIGRTKVTKIGNHNGVAIAEEGESENGTGLGKVRTKYKWKKLAVNEPAAAGTWERR